ncbi:MAG TPA: nucleotidyltransferase domain-containing protein [Levilinea sp.]|nr:nucleotidyltransferase domain-containing protein [Levilinea sp.]
MFGLTEATIQKIHAVLANYPQVEQAILYGSRAKGNYKPGSDIDLALLGTDLSLARLNQIANDLDDLLLPYHIDLFVIADIDQPDLIDQINRVGTVFYPCAHQPKERRG